MSGLLEHSPAEVMRKALIDLGLGTNPDDKSDWPVYALGEPDKPDSRITIVDTAGTSDNRFQINGARQESYGVQIKVVSAQHSTGFRKTNAIATALDRSIRRTEVTIGAASYMIHLADVRNVLDVKGRELPNTNRKFFSINAMVVINQTN